MTAIKELRIMHCVQSRFGRPTLLVKKPLRPHLKLNDFKKMGTNDTTRSCQCEGKEIVTTFAQRSVRMELPLFEAQRKMRGSGVDVMTRLTCC